MKAVKLYKIIWNLDNLDPKEREEAKQNLPTSKGFKADDTFDVVEKVPGLLRKKFGYGIKTFSYVEIPIYDTFEELLNTYTPRGEKPKKIYLKSGELSDFGERVVDALKGDVSKRFRLEFRGTNNEEMSKQMDMVMLSIEKIFGVEWEEENEESIMAIIDKEIESHVKLHLKKMDDEGDSDYDDHFLDDEDEEESFEE